SAILFLYKEVLKNELGWLEKVERAKKPPKLPVVLSHMEVKRIFAHLHGVPKLMAGLLYGSGLRFDGACATASQRCRFRARANNGARRKRRQRPPYHVAGKSVRTVAAAPRAGESTTRARCGRWIRQSSSSVCVKSKVAERGTRMGLAICFSF